MNLCLIPLLTACTTLEMPRFEFSRIELPFFKASRSEDKPMPVGRTQVVGVGFRPEVSVRLPPQDDAPKPPGGAKEGAAKGAAIACGPAAVLGMIPVVGWGLIAVCAVAVVPMTAMGALAGAIEDASKPRPEPATQELPPNQLLPALVARELALPEPGMALRMTPAQEVDYLAFAGTEHDSVLEISVRRISGEAIGDPDSIVLTIEADARLVRARDNLLRWERSYTEKAEFILPRAASQATGAVTAALAAAYPAIAARMAEDIRSTQALRAP